MSTPKTRLCTFRLTQGTLDSLEWLREHLQFDNATTALSYAVAFAKAENWVVDAKKHAAAARSRGYRKKTGKLKVVRSRDRSARSDYLLPGFNCDAVGNPLSKGE